MIVETIKHPLLTVSCMSNSMADHFKNNITDKQYEVLKHNVYTLESTDAVYAKYHGCGCGWVEIDKNGKPVELKYLDATIVDWRESDDGFAEVAVVPSQEAQALYLNTGQEDQNTDLLEFHTDQLAPMILPNGNIRLFVNFSSYQLVRF